jgi:hypothetical protein
MQGDMTMERREMQTTARTQDFLNTVALGSMLVFASVMPPLVPEGGEAVRVAPGGEGFGAGPDQMLDLSPDEMPA